MSEPEAKEATRRPIPRADLVTEMANYVIERRWFIAKVMGASIVLYAVLLFLIPNKFRAEAQILIQPPGALASVPDFLRYGALAAGSVAFMLTRRSIFAGVLCGEIVMLAGKWWLG